MQTVPEKEIMGHIADLFKGFADPTRVHILSLLLVRQELCVTEIAEEVGVSQSGVSHQLRLLKQMHLIKFRREKLPIERSGVLFFIGAWGSDPGRWGSRSLRRQRRRILPWHR